MRYPFRRAMDDPPRLDAYDDGQGLRAWCRSCQRWHLHGAGEGHRSAPCGDANCPYARSGYVLKTVGPWSEDVRQRVERCQGADG